TINAKSKSRIFNILSDNVYLKNIRLVNGLSDNGGAIYFKAETITIDNCSFINNTVSGVGGAFYGHVDNNLGIINNSKFINNSASSSSAIYNYGYYGEIDRCIFINNTGSSTISHQYSRDYVINSIFLDNTATTIISGRMKNNWFGNTYDNYKSSSLSNILYLNIKFTENYAIVSLNNLYSSSSTSVYTNYNLPEITLNINSTTLNLETDTITLDNAGQAIVPYTIDGETGALTVSYNGISLTKDRVLPEFDTLQTLIDNADENSVIELDKNYTYNSADEITEGIIINKNITIDGKGHTIDAKGMTRIFNVQALNVTFKNIIFANGYSNHGSAICCGMDNTEKIDFKIVNCTFVNNTDYDQYGYYAGGGAVYIKTNEGSFNITDSRFENNKATPIQNSWANGGAIYLNVKNSEVNIYNSSFISNSAYNGGAIYVQTDYSETIIDKSVFMKNNYYGTTSTRATAIFWKTT
ncbi:hypothetical protein, partial [Methanobrevibacter sp.]|uniref:hypothetical protein n=1 Tax=Methanobrevibacter sp. TaxID=66852 RepID=UPI0026E109C0